MKDPRGFTVFLPQERYDHAVRRHFEFLGENLKGLYSNVVCTMTDPWLILENPALQGPTMGPPRVTQEVYVSRLVPEYGVHIVLAMKAFDTTPFSMPPFPTMAPPVRVVWTAYDAKPTELPTGNVIWKATI